LLKLSSKYCLWIKLIEEMTGVIYFNIKLTFYNIFWVSDPSRIDTISLAK